MNWQLGRQGSGYFKLPLIISEKYKFDFYLLKYPKDSFIEPHTDKVAGFKHYRINLTIWGDHKAVKLYADSIFSFWRIYFFRPDEVLHEVSKVSSVRYVLSLGWIN